MKILSEKLKKNGALFMASTFMLTLSLGACSTKKTENQSESSDVETEQMMDEATPSEDMHEGHDHASEHPSSDSTAAGSEHPSGGEHPSGSEHPGM